MSYNIKRILIFIFILLRNQIKINEKKKEETNKHEALCKPIFHILLQKPIQKKKKMFHKNIHSSSKYSIRFNILIYQ